MVVVLVVEVAAVLDEVEAAGVVFAFEGVVVVVVLVGVVVDVFVGVVVDVFVGVVEDPVVLAVVLCLPPDVSIILVSLLVVLVG